MSHRSRFSSPGAVGTLVFGLILALPFAPALAAKKPKPALVSGTVSSVEGEPLAGARVTLVPVDAPGASITATTDRQGRFEMDVRAVPGSFRLRAESAGHQPFEGELELPAGGHQEVSFQLLPLALAGKQQAIESYNAGVTALREGDEGRARERWEEALRLDPELAEPRLALADLYLRQGEAGRAAEQIAGYLAARPDHAGAHALAYRIHRELGDAEAMARHRAALAGTEAAPELAAEIYNQGVAAYQRGDHEAALATFGEAMQLAPELAAAGSAAAVVLYDQERYAEAVEQAEAVLQRHPQDAKALRLRFLALEAQGAPAAQAALEAYAAAARDEALALLLEWGKKAFETDRLADAQRHLKQLLALAPDHPQGHLQLGLASISAGQHEEGKRHLRRFLELAPGDPDAATARKILAELG